MGVSDGQLGGREGREVLLKVLKSGEHTTYSLRGEGRLDVTRRVWKKTAGGDDPYMGGDWVKGSDAALEGLRCKGLEL